MTGLMVRELWQLLNEREVYRVTYWIRSGSLLKY